MEKKTISGLILAISEKTNDRRISRKFSGGGTDGQTDRQTDGQTDESDFVGRCQLKLSFKYQ